jgi:hypothetical protein
VRHLREPGVSRLAVRRLGLAAVREEAVTFTPEHVVADEGQCHLRRTSSIRGNVSGEDII